MGGRAGATMAEDGTNEEKALGIEEEEEETLNPKP